MSAIAQRFGGPGVDRAIELLDIAPLLHRFAHSLSSGERRRAELAMAAARRPNCLVADEPFLRITPKDMEEISNVLRQMADDGCAIAITGHEVSALFGVADDVLWLTAGTTHALGSPAEAKVHHQFRREYLGRM